MTRFLLALVLAGGAALPAFSMTAGTMPCHDFSMMDEAGQMAAMAPAEGAMATAGDSGAMAKTDDAGGMMASSDDGMMGATEACKAHPDMTVDDAMKAMH